MRTLPLLLLLPFLSACSGADWDYLTHFGTAEKAPALAAQPQQVATAATAAAAQTATAPDPFCMGVAREDAMENGFDTATQQKVAVRSYQQCVQLFGAAAGK